MPYNYNDVIVSHVLDPNNSRGVYSRAAFISLSDLASAAFIQGRRYSRAAFNRVNTVHGSENLHG